MVLNIRSVRIAENMEMLVEGENPGLMLFELCEDLEFLLNTFKGYQHSERSIQIPMKHFQLNYTLPEKDWEADVIWN